MHTYKRDLRIVLHLLHKCFPIGNALSNKILNIFQDFDLVKLILIKINNLN